MKTEKRKKIEIIDNGNVHKPKKRTCKDMLDRFEPLTEEQQKDLLYLILDNMDLYEDAMEKAKDEETEKGLYVHYSLYQFVANFLMNGLGWTSHRDLLLEGAHLDRLAWEKERKEEK